MDIMIRLEQESDYRNVDFYQLVNAYNKSILLHT